MITKYFLPVYFPTDDPDIGAMFIFKDVTPGYLKVQFLRWCEIALAEIDPSRTDALTAIYHVQTEFVQLIDAVYATSAAIGSDKSKRVLDELLQQYFDNYAKKGVERDSIPLPPAFCRSFFKEITAQSTKAILWLLVHAVTAYKEKYHYEKGMDQVLNLFHRYTAVVIVAEDWREILNARKESKKKEKAISYSKKKKKKRK